MPKTLWKLIDPPTLLLRVIWDGVPAGITAALAFYVSHQALAHFHWALALACALGTAVLAWLFAQFVLNGLTRLWPHLSLDDRLLRKHVKALTDLDLDREERHYATMRAQHAPRFGGERCPVCDTRSPVRCRGLLDAERLHYALRTERRLREDLVRLRGRESAPETDGPVDPFHTTD
ncbi:hypothetical protein [Phytomonospora endophytica]|uniref:Uncharacterized protein n=1 Tax=Phytomonospora endophytica TaxID=714109 RepID=A0A841FI91_9ACTN|nr:hypothetical protein [Phytomonospora endophytica]MBB6035475.1 hypothetical protein [Phytomonospora endophytica]GIG63772.1 hypothetical protein Pen01_00670 [Phytomonospora endophytica]